MLAALENLAENLGLTFLTLKMEESRRMLLPWGQAFILSFNN
jgi:hypothetical protein